MILNVSQFAQRCFLMFCLLGSLLLVPACDSDTESNDDQVEDNDGNGDNGGDDAGGDNDGGATDDGGDDSGDDSNGDDGSNDDNGDSDGGSDDGASDEVNNAPGSFSLTVESITHNAARLVWTASIDPDGDAVTYRVVIDEQDVATNLTATEYTITQLASAQEITGEVIASDDEGEETSDSFVLTTYVVDIEQYKSMSGFVSATLVDCSYKESGSGTCYRIVFNSNPVDDDGPYCPETTSDVGGFGNYDGETNPGFRVMKADLWSDMVADGYSILNGENVNVENVVPGGGRVLMSGGPSSAACLEPTPDDNLTLTFEIPVIPVHLSATDQIESVEYVGLALDGIPINGAPPSVVANNGKIPSLDRCGGHHDPAGYYHWHFLAAHMDATLQANGLLDTENDIECSKKTQSATALVGYARDGYPIYSGEDASGLPNDLDGCNGHTGATTEYPDGVYHYHSSTDITNVPPCIIGKQSTNSFDKPS